MEIMENIYGNKGIFPMESKLETWRESFYKDK